MNDTLTKMIYTFTTLLTLLCCGRILSLIVLEYGISNSTLHTRSSSPYLFEGTIVDMLSREVSTRAFKSMSSDKPASIAPMEMLQETKGSSTQGGGGGGVDGVDGGAGDGVDKTSRTSPASSPTEFGDGVVDSALGFSMQNPMKRGKQGVVDRRTVSSLGVADRTGSLGSTEAGGVVGAGEKATDRGETAGDVEMMARNEDSRIVVVSTQDDDSREGIFV